MKFDSLPDVIDHWDNVVQEFKLDPYQVYATWRDCFMQFGRWYDLDDEADIEALEHFGAVLVAVGQRAAAS